MDKYIINFAVDSAAPPWEKFGKKKVDQAIILKTRYLSDYIKNLKSSENISKVLIGNGTTSKDNIEKLDFIRNDLNIVED